MIFSQNTIKQITSDFAVAKLVTSGYKEKSSQGLTFQFLDKLQNFKSYISDISGIKLHM